MVMSKLRQVGIVSDHCLDDFGNNNRCTLVAMGHLYVSRPALCGMSEVSHSVSGWFQSIP